MQKRPMKNIGPAVAAALIACAALSAQAQRSHAQEYIVGQEVVSDTLNEGGVIQGESSSDGSFIGDMSYAAAGVGPFGRTYGQPDLFFNFYTQGNANTANAQMYMSPLPVPPNVGHTFFTYQPFYPHEMLYWHKDRFHKYYDNGRGMNRTRAVYFSPPVRQAASNFYWNYLRLPR